MCSEHDTSTTKKGTVNHNPEKPCHFSIIINAIVLSIKEHFSIYFVNKDFTLQLIFLRLANTNGQSKMKNAEKDKHKKTTIRKHKHIT